jgi:predicted transcriptional regulator
MNAIAWSANYLANIRSLPVSVEARPQDAKKIAKAIADAKRDKEAILRYVRANDRCAVTDMANLLGISKTQVHNYLRGLLETGHLTRIKRKCTYLYSLPK